LKIPRVGQEEENGRRRRREWEEEGEVSLVTLIYFLVRTRKGGAYPGVLSRVAGFG